MAIIKDNKARSISRGVYSITPHKGNQAKIILGSQEMDVYNTWYDVSIPQKTKLQLVGETGIEITKLF